MSRRSIRCGVFVLLSTFACFAQESRSEFSLQGNGFFTKSASGSAYTYSPTETGGFLIAYRYRLRRGLSAEVVYGFNRDTQKYDYTTTPEGRSALNRTITRRRRVWSRLCRHLAGEDSVRMSWQEVAL